MGNSECGVWNRFCRATRTTGPLDATDYRGFVMEHQPHVIPIRIPTSHSGLRPLPCPSLRRRYGPVLLRRIARSGHPCPARPTESRRRACHSGDLHVRRRLRHSFIYFPTQSRLAIQANRWNTDSIKNARMDTARFRQHRHAGKLNSVNQSVKWTRPRFVVPFKCYSRQAPYACSFPACPENDVTFFIVNKES